MDFYDRLQGIANHLVNFGFESDLIFFNLADIKLSVLHQVDLVSRETCLLKLGRNIWTHLRPVGWRDPLGALLTILRK